MYLSPLVAKAAVRSKEAVLMLLMIHCLLLLLLSVGALSLVLIFFFSTCLFLVLQSILMVKRELVALILPLKRHL